MNEAETRAELIDPKLKERGWGVEELDQEKLPELLKLTPCSVTFGLLPLLCLQPCLMLRDQ